jgi:hypothetical protein
MSGPKRIGLLENINIDSVVFPYYGYLDNAFLLLSALNSKTRMIWKKNEHVFIMTVNKISEPDRLTFQENNKDEIKMNSVALKYRRIGVILDKVQAQLQFIKILDQMKINSNEMKMNENRFDCFKATIEDLEKLSFLTLTYNENNPKDSRITTRILKKYLAPYFSKIHLSVTPGFNKLSKKVEPPLPFVNEITKM